MTHPARSTRRLSRRTYGIGMLVAGALIVVVGLLIVGSTRSIRRHSSRVADVPVMTAIVGVGLCIGGGYLLVRGRAIARAPSDPSPPKASARATPGRTCPRCQAEVRLAATFCPTCGQQLT